VSRPKRLAEGEELSSNPLCRVFNDLPTTSILVHVDWRILQLLLAISNRWGQCRFATRRLILNSRSAATDPSERQYQARPN
jgi:hypothetical protein